MKSLRTSFVFGLIVGGLVCIITSVLALLVLKLAADPVNVLIYVFIFGAVAFIIGAIVGIGE